MAGLGTQISALHHQFWLAVALGVPHPILGQAIKANPMPAAVAHMSTLVEGLDIASLGEMSVALDGSINSATISFAGPGKRDVELRAAAAGVTINLESPGELAGQYICRVIDRKVSRGGTFLIVDGGLHHHLAASGNFGLVTRKNYPVVAGIRVFRGERETVSVVGPLCTPLDLLGDKIELGKAEVDDLIVLLQSGAYSFSASPQAILDHPEPVEVLV